MANETDPTGNVAPKMREMAEQSVAQAKEAYERYVGSTERMMNTMEETARSAWSGARDVNHKIASFAEANAKAGFDYAERFVRAKDAQEVAKLQQDYLKETGERLGQQAREIGELAASAAQQTMEASRPKS